MNGAGTRPRVTALMPAWRAATFIDATLEAWAAQRDAALEIVVSDDASPDDTAARCERFAARDARVRVVRQPRNLGWVGNVNALLAGADGDYLVFAFQDDLPRPDYVARCVDALERDTEAVLAFSDIELVHPDGRHEDKTYPELDGERDRLRRARRVAAQEGSWWIPNRGVFRAAAARAIGGLYRHRAGEFSADWPWLLHMSLLGPFARVPERLVTKIYHARSLSRGWNFGARSWLAVTGSAMGHVRRAGLPAAERWRLQAELAGFAAGAIARGARRRARLGLRRVRFGSRASGAGVA